MAAYYSSVIYTCMEECDTPGQNRPLGSIQVWDAESHAIAFAHSPEEALSISQSTLRQMEIPNKKEIKIKKIEVVPLVEQMLTESGNVPLDWPKILEQFEASLEATPEDDFEQGYWVDVNEMVRPDKLSFSASTLESDLPEDIRSGLNWSSEKKFFFLLLMVPASKPSWDPIARLGEIVEGPGEPENENSTEPSVAEMEVLNAVFPETVALIQARNAAVAAWLWRRYTANTKWKTSPIQITQLCGVVNGPD
jgi:hypothetical protein